MRIDWNLNQAGADPVAPEMPAYAIRAPGVLRCATHKRRDFVRLVTGKECSGSTPPGN